MSWGSGDCGDTPSALPSLRGGGWEFNHQPPSVFSGEVGVLSHKPLAYPACSSRGLSSTPKAEATPQGKTHPSPTPDGAAGPGGVCQPLTDL